jgi:uncharacterized membrane protein YbhN (UPF0104 family)
VAASRRERRVAFASPLSLKSLDLRVASVTDSALAKIEPNPPSDTPHLAAGLDTPRLDAPSADGPSTAVLATSSLAPAPLAERLAPEDPAAEPGTDLATSTGRPKPWLLRHWQIPVAVIMLVVAYLTLRGRLPSMDSVRSAWSSANVEWIIIAAAFELISNNLFARQQQTLLKGVGVRMSFPRALAVTYARSALAISMPAGSAVSAAYAFGQFKRSGATNDKATAAMILCGVVSFLGLASLYVAGVLGLLATDPVGTVSAHPFLVSAIGAGVVAAAAGWLIRRRWTPSHPRTLPVVREARTWTDKVRVGVAQAVDAWRSLRGRDWVVAGSFSIVNWLTDLLCLAAAARAFNLTVGLPTLATIYLGVQLVRQLPITPGGIGLIETGLLAGLLHAGASAGAAAAAVLTYRLMSCWLLIPLGGLAWLGLRAGASRDQRLTAASPLP